MPLSFQIKRNDKMTSNRIPELEGSLGGLSLTNKSTSEMEEALRRNEHALAYLQQQLNLKNQEVKLLEDQLNFLSKELSLASQEIKILQSRLRLEQQILEEKDDLIRRLSSKNQPPLH